MSNSTTTSTLVPTTTTIIDNVTNATSVPPSAPPGPDWPGARIFSASVAAIYMTLAVVTLILFARKLRQTCSLLSRQEDEQRLLSNGNENNNGTSQSGNGTESTRASSHYGAGLGGHAVTDHPSVGRNISSRDRQLQSEDFKRYYGGASYSGGNAVSGRNQLGTGYYGNNNNNSSYGNNNNRPFAHHRPSVPESNDDDGSEYGVGTPGVGGGRGGGGLAGHQGNLNDVTRTSTIGSNLDYYGNNPGVAPSVSDVVVEVRSHTSSDLGGGGGRGGGHGSIDNSMTVTDRGGASAMNSRFASRGNSRLGNGGGDGCCSCCDSCCSCGDRCYCFFKPLATLLTHCCCLPASFFAERHRSSLLLLGSMFFYSISRFAEVTANTAAFGNENQGAASLYQTVITSIPATMLLLLQLSFNLKWVVNVRNISSSGAPEGSRLSLGPSRSALSFSRGRNNNNRKNGGRSDSTIPVDEEDPDSPCSIDIGTASLALGVFFIVVAPMSSCFGLAAWLAKPTDAEAPSSDTHNEFLGIEDDIWMKILTGMYAVPYAVNGLATFFLGFVLKTVWKPFSDVATRASLHMFAVAVLWGGLCFVRGMLLLSYDLSHFNHATHSPYASSAVLVAEGSLIYLVVFIFFLASRNQDQVVAAEKEARKKLERGLGSSGPGGLKRRGLTRPGDDDDDYDSSDDDNEDSDDEEGTYSNNEITQSGRLKLGGSNRGSTSDLDAMNNNNNINRGSRESKDRLHDGRPKKRKNKDGNNNNSSKHKRRAPKGMDAAAAAAERLGDGNGRGGGGNNKDQLGLPVYSTWSSHSQTPSRAVSENFGAEYYSRGGGDNVSNASTSNQNFHQQHHHHNTTSNIHNQLSGRGDAMSPDAGQPTQSRLFYED